MKMRLTCLPPTGMELTEGRRTMERGGKSQVVQGHNEETQPPQRGEFE